MSKPRVWLVPYAHDWSFDITAKAIAKHLAGKYELHIAYTADIEAERHVKLEADAYVDFWWHGTIHYTWGRRVVKQVSSHRWAQQKWGKLKPTNLLHTYADDVGAIVVPSERLHSILSGVDPGDGRAPRPIMIAKKGFDPEMFFDDGSRIWPELRVGWAGSIVSVDKHVSDLMAVEPELFIAGGTSVDEIEVQRQLRNAAPRDYADMPAFYNGIDVIAIASEAEGDPRPLIEGMACGCFPVTTDVGIASELIEHMRNGYIIPTETRGPAAFRAAFEWCRANLEYVRAAGRANAEWMSNHRTWEAVMPTWDAAIERAIENGAKHIGEPGPFSLLDEQRARELA